MSLMHLVLWMSIMLAINVAALEVIYNPYQDIDHGCINTYSYEQEKSCPCDEEEAGIYGY